MPTKSTSTAREILLRKKIRDCAYIIPSKQTTVICPTKLAKLLHPHLNLIMPLPHPKPIDMNPEQHELDVPLSLPDTETAVDRFLDSLHLQTLNELWEECEKQC
jgi:hypothetical protein